LWKRLDGLRGRFLILLVLEEALVITAKESRRIDLLCTRPIVEK
jgi:hypothetical protein